MFDIEAMKDSIICGEAVETLKRFPSSSVDMIFADPPYFMQTEGALLRTDGSKFNGVEDKWDKFQNFSDYDNFSTEWLTECKRILKNDGTIWVIGSFQNIYRLGYIMQNLGFWILNDVVWSKPNAVPNFGGTRFQNSHETLIWCSKNKKSKYTFNYKTMKFLNNDKQEKSVWDIGICIGNERLKNDDGKKIHSTQKPEKLLYNVILSSTKPNEIVLDPFFGTGTTGAVAKKLGRNFIGIERELEYVTAAQLRIDKIRPQMDFIADLSLETKPPKVPIKTLINAGYLHKGQELFSPDKKTFVILNSDGNVTDGKEALSIHKMSAKILGKNNNNGWSYFLVKHNQGFTPIDELRYAYMAEVQNA